MRGPKFSRRSKPLSSITGAQLLRRAYSKSALATPLVAAAFGEWYAARTWGPTWGTPTAEDLLTMIAQ